MNKETKQKQFRSGDYRKALSLKFDNRVHFALSYLTQSSPTVRVYSAQAIDEELHMAGQQFLQKVPRNFDFSQFFLKFFSEYEN